MQTIIIYLLFINVIVFFLYGSDKQKAKKNQWRIPEKTLILLAVAGGSMGAFMGMQVFRHKTRKPVFRYGIPFIILCQAGMLLYFLYKLF